jgi:hypothetical protein
MCPSISTVAILGKLSAGSFSASHSTRELAKDLSQSEQNYLKIYYWTPVRTPSCDIFSWPTSIPLDSVLWYPWQPEVSNLYSSMKNNKKPSASSGTEQIWRVQKGPFLRHSIYLVCLIALWIKHNPQGYFYHITWLRASWENAISETFTKNN